MCNLMNVAKYKNTTIYGCQNSLQSLKSKRVVLIKKVPIALVAPTAR